MAPDDLGVGILLDVVLDVVVGERRDLFGGAGGVDYGGTARCGRRGGGKGGGAGCGRRGGTATSARGIEKLR